MKPIRNIICCCGSGLGSSMMVQMNIETYLKNRGITNIKVNHCSLSDAMQHKDDLFVVGLDIAPRTHSYDRVIVMKEIINMDELIEKLDKAFSMQDQDRFRIE